MKSRKKECNYSICIQLTIQLVIFIAISFSFNPYKAYAESSNIKWQPGHYMRFKDNHPENNMRTFLSNQYTKGIMVHINWSDIEPAFNKYDFEKIDYFLDLVSSYNKFLIIDIVVRCFNSGCTHANAPEYIRKDPFYNGGVVLLIRPDDSVKGSTVRLWDSVVVDRLVKLLEAIGNKYDDDSNLVGVSLPSESAMALGKFKGDYTAESYETQLKRIASAMASTMPKTIGITGMNFFPGAKNKKATFNRIAEHLVKTGCGAITHPDTVPEGYNMPQYEVEIAFNNKLAIVAQFQTWNITNEINEEDIFLFATETLGSQFVVWNQHFTSKHDVERPNYVSDYVLPVVNKYKGETTTEGLPESYISTVLPAAPQNLSVVEDD